MRAGVGDGDAFGGGEFVRIRGHIPDVLVFQQRPELGDVVPAHRRARAQFPIRRIWVARVEVGGVKRECRTQRNLPRRSRNQTSQIYLSDTSCVYLMSVALSILVDSLGYHVSWMCTIDVTSPTGVDHVLMHRLR